MQKTIELPLYKLKKNAEGEYIVTKFTGRAWIHTPTIGGNGKNKKPVMQKVSFKHLTSAYAALGHLVQNQVEAQIGE